MDNAEDRLDKLEGEMGELKGEVKSQSKLLRWVVDRLTVVEDAVHENIGLWPDEDEGRKKR